MPPKPGPGTESTTEQSKEPCRQALPCRGCTLGGYKIVELFKDRKSVIFGVWAATGGRGTLPKGGGAKPPTFWEGIWGHRGRPDPQNDRFPIRKKIGEHPPKVQPRYEGIPPRRGRSASERAGIPDILGARSHAGPKF